MKFPQALYLLVLVSLTLALICSEIPESRALTDDVSNDLVVGSAAPTKMVAKIAADQSISKPLFPTSRELITSNRGILSLHSAAPFLGEDIFHLHSIQRK
jgi:hypothetical protein